MIATRDVSPIFIGGLMKSGTSLLRKLLSRHSEIYGGLETHWFTDDLMKNWRDITKERARWMREFFDVSEADHARLANDAKSGPEFLDRFMWFCTERANKKRWVEKTPDNILHVPLIREHWPNAIVLFVDRDPRDVYASWKRNQKRSLDAFLDNARAVKAAARGLETVRYEELVTDTERVMRQVCAAAKVAWEPALAEYEGDASDFDKVLAVTGKESPTTESLKKPIFTSSVGQWKDILSAEEVARINKELAP